MPARPWRLLAALALALSGCTEEKIPEYAASGTVPYSPPEQIREREPLPCDERAIVLLSVPGCLGNGFVFGDGSLVATAYHVIRNASRQLGDDRIQSRPFVLSRYWGDVFEAKIVVTDATADFAILEVSWPGHPALGLATKEESSGVQEVMGGGLIWPGHEHDPTIGAPRLETERFWIRLGDPEQVPWVQSGRVERMGRGWSGCPLVLAESGKIAGIFTALGPQREARAAAACQLASLVDTFREQRTSKALATTLPERPKDAEIAFAAAGRLIQAARRGKDEAALGIGAEFVSLRPDSPMAHALFAQAALRAGHQELAEEHVAEALRLQPGNSYLRYGYVCVLERGCKLDQAEAQLVMLTEMDRDNPAVWFWLAEFLLEYQGDRRTSIQALLDKAETLNVDRRIPPREIEALRAKIEG